MPTTPRILRSLCLGLAILLLQASLAGAREIAAATSQETEITVRVISRGAKFVGTSIGGARITLHDAETGELLGQGKTRGSTGDTDRIMRQSHAIGDALSTPGAAKLDLTLKLDEPRRVRFTAFGPLAQKQSATEASIIQWVLPGKHLTGGDGILLELPGFLVDVLSPPSHAMLGKAPQTVDLLANLTMACGCPTSPGGLWDSAGYEIRALIARDGEMKDDIPLTFADRSSQFTATWTADEPGAYEVTVYAYDPQNGNTGIDKTTFILTGD